MSTSPKPIFFTSGVSALVYQVVWTRQLALVFGVTIHAVSVVLAVFMGGLALGYYLGGKFAGRVRRPLLAYAGLEAGIAVLALLGATGCDDLLMDFDGCAKHKSALGTAAVIVMDKSTDIIRAIARLAYFYKHESCGQCTPCREGTGWLSRVVDRIENGQGRPSDMDLLDSVAGNIMGRTICALGDAAAMAVREAISSAIRTNSANELAPIFFITSINPVLVGLIPTCRLQQIR